MEQTALHGVRTAPQAMRMPLDGHARRDCAVRERTTILTCSLGPVDGVSKFVPAYPLATTQAVGVKQHLHHELGAPLGCNDVL